MIRHADCQAVVMFDARNRVIANIHCGWRGSASRILTLAVKEFASVYGSSPKDLWVGISPSLGPCCGEFKHWRTMLLEWLHAFRCNGNHIDFWQVSISELSEAGIPKRQIYCASICTVCNQEYFSYRRDKTTGRLATVVVMP